MLSTPPAFILSQDQTLMFKFVLGHSKAWLFYNRFLLCLKSVHIEKNRSTTLALRFAVWRSPNLSVAACISSNKFDSLHSSSILFFSLVSKSFKVISLFSYQGCLLFSPQRQLLYLTKVICFCQELFWTFFKIQNAEGGIWTLAPVTRPIPLAGAPLRPLEYFCLPEWLQFANKLHSIYMFSAP